MAADKQRRSYGTGSLFQRADAAGRLTWYCKVYVDGKPYKRALGPVREPGKRNGLTVPQAERAKDAKRNEIANTVQVEEVLDIKELGRRKMRAMEAAGNKPGSISDVKSILDVWLVPHFGDMPITKITAADIEDLMAKMRTGDRPKDGQGRVGRPLKPKTIRNYIGGGLSPMLKLAKKRKWLAENPMDDIVLPEVRNKGDIRFLTIEEVAAVVRCAQDGPYRDVDAAVFEVAAKTGLRQGELLGLRWRDVDWSARQLRVVLSWSTKLSKLQITKTDGSDRAVPLWDDVLVALDDHHKRTQLPTGRDDQVFADPITGTPMNADHLRTRFKAALRDAGIDEHRFHDLRHTFGTRMAATGVPIRTLQAWMGHANIMTTQRYADYARAPEHELNLMKLAWRTASIEPTSEVDSAAVAAWLREHQPDVYAQALEALAVTA